MAGKTVRSHRTRQQELCKIYMYKNVHELTEDISLINQTVQESSQKIGSSSLSKWKFYLGGQNTKKN